jgi:hypothetical protein
MRVNFPYKYVYYAEAVPLKPSSSPKPHPGRVLQYLAAVGPRFHEYARSHFIGRQIGAKKIEDNAYCGPASWLLALIMEQKFDLPIGGQGFPRLEMITSFHPPSSNEHVCLKYLLDDTPAQVLIDPTAGQFDRLFRDKICLAALPEGLAQFGVQPVLEYLQGLIASGLFSAEKRPLLQSWLDSVSADYRASRWPCELPPEELRYEESGLLVKNLPQDKGYVWEHNVSVLQDIYFRAQRFLDANPG